MTCDVPAEIIHHGGGDLRPPFRAEVMEGLYRKVLWGKYPRIPPPYGHDLSDAAALLLQAAAAAAQTRRSSPSSYEFERGMIARVAGAFVIARPSSHVIFTAGQVLNVR